MKKVLFIDRDGTIIAEPDDFQVDALEKVRFLPGVITSLATIARETDYALVMVTNQDGLGTPGFQESSFMPAHELVLRTLAGEGVEFADVFIDRSFAHENLPTRKPGTGMLGKYLSGEYDLAGSYVIGDRPTDVQLAANLGAGAIYLVNPSFPLEADLGAEAVAVRSWDEIGRFLCRPPRIAKHHRRTNETDIAVQLDLDGEGESKVSTGLSFLDHMLDQLAKHASIDLKVTASGDLHVDEHHTIEDVAIVLGEAFSIALGDKLGLERYGFCLPMDDCLAQVAVDFGGRNWVVWEAEFKREKIGDMPTEMFFHFFKSFSDKAMCNLNIKAEGTNEHHKIESIFKAFARAIKMALRRDGTRLASTKGVL